MEEKEYSNVYAIPANYTDSGKLLGGMVEPRNAVEAVALVIMVGYPEVKWIPMPTTIRIVIMTVTLIPLAVVAFMGIGGDSLLQYLGHILSFWENRRILHFTIPGWPSTPSWVSVSPKLWLLSLGWDALKAPSPATVLGISVPIPLKVGTS